MKSEFCLMMLGVVVMVFSIGFETHYAEWFLLRAKSRIPRYRGIKLSPGNATIRAVSVVLFAIGYIIGVSILASGLIADGFLRQFVVGVAAFLGLLIAWLVPFVRLIRSASLDVGR